jgi:hypothetical protein
MAAPDDLINKGFIVNRQGAEAGRTFIVTGLHRSGTSLVAALLRQTGLFIGNDANEVVYEDQEIARLLTARDSEALRQLIAARNADHPRWGFKYPRLCYALDAADLRWFDRPHVIVTFRDPVSMAVRTSLSEYREPMRTMRDVIADQNAMMAFISQLDCPNLLLSYEKILMFPQDFIDAMLAFCDIPCGAELRARLLATIEPNRPRYLISARRRFDGLIEGVRGGQLYGWCALTKSAEAVTLDVLVDDRVSLTLVADIFRQDLLDAGIGEGRHGYFVPLDALQARWDSVIRVRVARHGVELDNSGTRLCDFGSAA